MTKQTNTNKALELKIMEALKTGEKKLDTPLITYSERTPREVYTRTKKIFNLYKKDIKKEVQDAWKTDSRRPISRNKMVVVVSHLINELLVPSVKAKTKDGKHDEKSARIMRDLLDHVQEKARYRKQMLYFLLEAVASPVAGARIGYSHQSKMERYYDEEGNLQSKKVIDEHNSGFFMRRIAFGNLLVPNINESNIQKQPWVIIKDLVPFETAQAIFGHLPAFAKVQPGQYLSQGNNGEYVADNNRKTIVEDGMVEIVEFFERGTDTQAVMINGVVVEDKPITRMDKNIPVVTLGYEPITNEAEFFFFPAILKLAEDQELLEQSYNTILDGMKLGANPPTYVNRRIGAKSVMPGAFTVGEDDFKASPIVQGRDYGPAIQNIQMLENSMEQSSPAVLGGIKQSGEQSRYQFQVLSDNAMAPHGLFRANIRETVYDITQLQISDVTQYITKSALSKITEKLVDIETIVIPKSIDKNKAVDKEIRFISPYGALVDPMERSYGLYKEQKNSKRKIYEVNPLAFAELKFSVVPDPQVDGVENKEQKAIKEERFFTMLRQQENVDINKLTERYIKSHDPYAVEDLLKSESKLKQMLPDPGQGSEIKQLGGADNAPAPDKKSAIPFS